MHARKSFRGWSAEVLACINEKSGEMSTPLCVHQVANHLGGIFYETCRIRCAHLTDL